MKNVVIEKPKIVTEMAHAFTEYMKAHPGKPPVLVLGGNAYASLAVIPEAYAGKEYLRDTHTGDRGVHGYAFDTEFCADYAYKGSVKAVPADEDFSALKREICGGIRG